MAKLYLISPPNFELENFLLKLDEALATGKVAVFQLRLKLEPYGKVSNELMLEYAKAIKPVCDKHKVELIINDNVKVASEVGASGVHLGEDDVSVKQAREILGEGKIIGASCYDSLDLAFSAGEQGANYVAFGAFYPTTSKPAEKLRKAEVELLTFWNEFANIPCVAIGGINADNAQPLKDAGADFIAVISSVWNSDNIARAIDSFNCHSPT